MISEHTGEGMSGLTVCVRERQRERLRWRFDKGWSEAELCQRIIWLIPHLLSQVRGLTQVLEPRPPTVRRRV